MARYVNRIRMNCSLVFIKNGSHPLFMNLYILRRANKPICSLLGRHDILLYQKKGCSNFAATLSHGQIYFIRSSFANTPEYSRWSRSGRSRSDHRQGCKFHLAGRIPNPRRASGSARYHWNQIRRYRSDLP